VSWLGQGPALSSQNRALASHEGAASRLKPSPLFPRIPGSREHSEVLCPAFPRFGTCSHSTSAHILQLQWCQLSHYYYAIHQSSQLPAPFPLQLEVHLSDGAFVMLHQYSVSKCSIQIFFLWITSLGLQFQELLMQFPMFWRPLLTTNPPSLTGISSMMADTSLLNEFHLPFPVPFTSSNGTQSQELQMQSMLTCTFSGPLLTNFHLVPCPPTALSTVYQLHQFYPISIRVSNLVSNLSNILFRYFYFNLDQYFALQWISATIPSTFDPRCWFVVSGVSKVTNAISYIFGTTVNS